MKYQLVDPTVQTLAGIITAVISASVVQSSWNMFLGMILGNFIGMFFMIILMVPLTIVFGGFEIMVPLFLVTMLCGMIGGMLGTIESISLNQVAVTGALVSLLIFVYVAWSDHKLRGLVPK
jgi:hypothetical protein